MEKQKIYIETSIISYLTARPSRDIVVAGLQQVTQDWWNVEREKYDCFISQFVINEISKGDSYAANQRLKAIDNMLLLDYSGEIDSLAITYAALFQIPEKSRIDAFHLAAAVLFEMDYLLSWNCKHIANGIIAYKLIEYNSNKLLHIPVLCTPLELLEV
jgi:hypothetical protein